MKVMVVGGGGREHALCWKLASSPQVREVLCAPGNPGIEEVGRNVDVGVEDPAALLAVAKSESVGLVVVGPEVPLCRGLADDLRKASIPVFGPGAGGAELEGSKAFSKGLMNRHGIPTAGYRVFHDRPGARDYLEGEVAFPVVVKASGLASGKGVLICEDRPAAEAAVDRLMVDRAFGTAGDMLIIEDFVAGEEVSVHSLTDGRTFLTLPTSQDHKRLSDGDQGPNTGGMGAISPSRRLDDAGVARVEREIVVPTVDALARAGRPYRGVLYTGLMVTRSGPKVLEYNVRFGDPETQVLVPRLDCDLFELLLACAEGRLGEVDESKVRWDPRPAMTVVLAAEGYPRGFHRGHVIEGLDAASRTEGVLLFHAGTERVGARVVTAGGRVLAVTARGDDLETARQRAYEAIGKIHFPGMHYRRDIGHHALKS